MAKPDITPERLRELFDYDPDTGIFSHKVGKRGVAKRKLSAAGYTDPLGYVHVCANNVLYKAHRLAFLWVHGRWPSGDTDHIDGNRSNNRISNLREATRSVNCQNQRVRRNSTTGVLGVYVMRGRYQAKIKINRKSTCIGTFDTIAEASAAYTEAKRHIHPGSVPREQ